MVPYDRYKCQNVDITYRPCTIHNHSGSGSKVPRSDVGVVDAKTANNGGSFKRATGPVLGSEEEVFLVLYLIDF